MTTSVMLYKKPFTYRQRVGCGIAICTTDHIFGFCNDKYFLVFSACDAEGESGVWFYTKKNPYMKKMIKEIDSEE